MPTRFLTAEAPSQTLDLPVPRHGVQYRPDIDGLRAVAVLGVICFHMFLPRLSGGYVGVDVFFVISGYLITSILLKDLQQGRLSLVDFYRRRAKRIFPALSVVLFCALLLGWTALLPAEFVRLCAEVKAGAAFYSNLYYARHVGYFDGMAITKPLMHLWSLGIEEQFYLIFPLSLLLCRKLRINPGVLICAALAYSLWLNVTRVHVDRVAAFYWPQTRLWELLIGAAIAFFQSRLGVDASGALHSPPQTLGAGLFGTGLLLAIYALTRAWWARWPAWAIVASATVFLIAWGLLLGRRVSAALTARTTLLNAASVAGAVLLYQSATTFDSIKTLFPGWNALQPCAGTALLIIAGPDAWINKFVLANPVLVAVGLISYPLYLWHWPLFSFAYILDDGYHEWLQVPLVAASFALAVLTYFLIEKPARKSKSSRAVIVPAATIACVALVCFYLGRQDGFAFRPHIRKYAQQVQAIEWETQEGPSATPWCLNRFKINDAGYCLLAKPDQDPTVALIGDSHAHHFYPGLKKHYSDTKENLLLLGGSGCVPFYNVASSAKIDPDHCMNVINRVYDLIERTQSIKTVIFAGRGSGYVLGTQSFPADYWNRKISLAGADPNLPYPEVFRQAFRNSILRLKDHGKKLVFIYDVPELCLDPRTCIHMRPISFAHEKLTDPCAVSVSWYRARNVVYNSVVKSIAKEFPDVKMFDPGKYLCDDKFCWGMKDGVLLYRDDNHLSAPGSLYLADKFNF